MNKRQNLLQRIRLLKRLAAKMRQLLDLLQRKKNYHAFAKALGKRESGGNYRAVNAYGYLGKYQFGLARLCDLGYTQRKHGTIGFSNNNFIWKTGYSKKMFLRDSRLQDKVFKEHCIQLAREAKIHFSKHLDRTFSGIDISVSGLVAGMHLGGLGGVQQFFRGSNVSDAFGTKVSEYIKRFGGYKLESLLV